MSNSQWHADQCIGDRALREHDANDGRSEVINALRLWAQGRREDETAHRPEQNIYKRCLERTWDQVLRKLDEMDRP